MRFYADLHIHSKYSRATSKDCNLENLSYWGSKKGIGVIGTGDFTHPAWINEIKEKLIPAEAGLFRLKPEIEKAVSEKLPKHCQNITPRFMLSVEISTIYKKGDKVRKIHHLVYVPTIEKAEKINTALEKIGNIRSDGRPILGLDSRHLLEIVLSAGEDCFLVPAHIWTPWFAVLGSKSGFDAVADCYADLADHIFAVETGLSSDPEMNWKVSSLDRYRLISNSDAHSPPKLGREACAFDTEMDYYSLRKALETGRGFGGTVEFFPEEGKYHLDGHRNCSVRFEPEESKAHNGICPVCQKPLTLGVMYRVHELADRHTHEKPAGASDYQNLIPLPEILSEIQGSGVTSGKVVQEYEGMLQKLGPELEILSAVPEEQIKKSCNSIVAEAISRMRKGEVIRDAGYDGEYGRIKLFKEGELKNKNSVGVLFEVEPKNSSPHPALSPLRGERETMNDSLSLWERVGVRDYDIKGDRPNSPWGDCHQNVSPLDLLDSDQRRAVEIIDGPLMIVAGPGSGKTRTLTHRVANLIQNHGIRPEACLTITFTRRAAEEMKTRLKQLVPDTWEKIPIHTFHGLAYQMLEENRVEVGLPRGFRIASEEERIGLIKDSLKVSERKAKTMLAEIRRKKVVVGAQLIVPLLDKARETEGWLDYDDLLILSLQLLEEDAGLRKIYQDRYAYISIDEYQDIDELQYRLVRLLTGEKENLCVIGDPDQAIYSFRGAKVGFFMKFLQDFPRASKMTLNKNYRSGGSIVSASLQMISQDSLVEDRQMNALLEDPGRVHIHEARSDKAEAEFVVSTIEKMMGGISFFSMDSERSEGKAEHAYTFSDFAVLYRTDAQAGVLEEALKRSGIPYQKCSHEDADLWDPRAERVSMMTLHAAKGLEFSNVFITGCEDGILPLKWGGEISAAALAEERRIFFVGMTRAKEKLFLSYAARRLRNGKVKEQARSPFIKDIEAKLLEVLKNKRKTCRRISKEPQLDLF